MLIDEKGKLFGKISIVDIFALLVIVVLIVGSAYKFGGFGKMATDKEFDKLQYKILVPAVRDQSIVCIRVGDKVFDTKTRNPIGTIVDKKIQPSKDKIIKADGTVAWSEKPDRKDVVVTIEAPGVESTTGYLVYGYKEINNESTVPMETLLVSIEPKVIEIKNLSKQK